MNIEIRDVTEENLREILFLHVKEDQKHYLESTEQCLEDARKCDYYQPVGFIGMTY